MDDSINTGPVPVEQIQDTPEFHRLVELEQVVKRGLASNPELIAALAEIHSRKLYKQRGFSGFAAYLKEHWGISRAHGYRLVAAAKPEKVSPNETKSTPNKTQPTAPTKVDSAIVAPSSKDIGPDEESVRVNDVDEELDRFKQEVKAWKSEFLPDELSQLLEQIKAYVDEILGNLPEQELKEVA
jgi:hypothetical protein